MGQRASVLLAAAVGVGCPADPPAFPSAGDDAATSDDDDDDGSDDDGPMPATDGTDATTSDPMGDGTTAGGPSTASDATDGDPTTDPSDGPSLPCGNGALDADEDCDDANASEIDGCTTSCRIGPVGIDIDPNGGMATLVNFGGAAATVMEASCPAGQVLVALEAHVAPLAILGISGRCGALTLVDDVAAGTDLRVLGSSQGNATSGECPTGQVLGQVAAAGDSGELTGLVPTCRTLAVTGSGSNQALTLEPGDELDQLGPQMPFSPSSCQPGQVATAIRVPVLDGQAAGIGLRCSPISLTYP